METKIKISGKILFDPIEFTSKQKRQGEWKKVAMIMLEPELGPNDSGISEYYAWFIRKRFGIHLSKPLRGAHVTIVNDRESETNGKWEEVKKKWDGKEIDVILNVDPLLGAKNRKGNYTDWWLTVPYEDRKEIHSIREELQLIDRPFFGLHMTIGTAVNTYSRVEEGLSVQRALRMNEEQSEYIIKLAQDEYFD